jgi:hypothetical protein
LIPWIGSGTATSAFGYCFFGYWLLGLWLPYSWPAAVPPLFTRLFNSMYTWKSAAGDFSAARRSAAILGILLAAAVASVVVAHLCMQNDSVLLDGRLAEWKRTNGVYRDNRFYENPEDRLLDEEIPNADYSKGGVYFIGASNMQTSLWTLPPAEQELIHNYAIGGSTYTQQFHLIRYLVEQEGLMRAGGDKTCVIVGLYFGNGDHGATLSPASLFRRFFVRDGMYTYDWERGVELAAMSPRWRRLRIEQIRDQAFYTWLFKVIVGGWGLDYLRPVNRQATDAIQDYWLNRLGPDWKAGMELEIEQLGQMVDYLQSHGTIVKAIYLPEGSWFQGYLLADYHRQRVFEILSRKSVSITDLSHEVPDNEFDDSVHLGYTGVQEVEPTILELALDHLRRKGLLH